MLARVGTTPNTPPNNSPQPIEDHNILSASGISIDVTTEQPWIVTINASNASIPQRFGITLPELLKLASEAVSRTAKELDVSDYKISLMQHAEAEQGAAANP